MMNEEKENIEKEEINNSDNSSTLLIMRSGYGASFG